MRFRINRRGFETQVLDTEADEEVICTCDDRSWATLIVDAMNADWEQFRRAMNWKISATGRGG